MQKQRPLCQALPNLSPVVPLLVWLSFTEIQLGKNSICGPDATSEVTRKNSRESAGPLGEKRKSRHTGEAAPANIPTFTDTSFSWIPGKTVMLLRSQRPHKRRQGGIQAVVDSLATQLRLRHRTCSNINKRGAVKEREQRQSRKANKINGWKQRPSLSVIWSAPIFLKTFLDPGLWTECRDPAKCQKEATSNCLNAPTPFVPSTSISKWLLQFHGISDLSHSCPAILVQLTQSSCGPHMSNVGNI